MNPDEMTSGYVPKKRDAAVKMVRLRTLWTMVRPPNKPLTAAIFDTTYGHELRVMVGDAIDNTIDTLLSRSGDEPLEARADSLRVTLAEQGWTPDAPVS